MRALIVLVALAPAWGVRAQSVEARLGDLRLATAVRIALVDDTATRALDVDVTAETGAVRLSGDGASGEAAVRVARSVAGVRSVNGRGDAAPAQTVRVETPRVEMPRVETPREDASPAPSPPARTGWGAAPEAPAQPAPRPAETRMHTVARGDTLFSLARQYGTNVEALRALNNLGPRDGIQVGQRLRVR